MCFGSCHLLQFSTYSCQLTHTRIPHTFILIISSFNHQKTSSPTPVPPFFSLATQQLPLRRRLHSQGGQRQDPALHGSTDFDGFQRRRLELLYVVLGVWKSRKWGGLFFPVLNWLMSYNVKNTYLEGVPCIKMC